MGVIVGRVECEWVAFLKEKVLVIAWAFQLRPKPCWFLCLFTYVLPRRFSQTRAASGELSHATCVSCLNENHRPGHASCVCHLLIYSLPQSQRHWQCCLILKRVSIWLGLHQAGWNMSLPHSSVQVVWDEKPEEPLMQLASTTALNTRELSRKHGQMCSTG